MKKFFAIFLVGSVLVLTGISVFAQSENSFYPEKIEDFSVEIEIKKDGSALFKESISYDFGQNLKHGIYRDIPLGALQIKVIKVGDEAGNNYRFETQKEFKYLKIKIGDPNSFVSGKKIYNIFYSVENPIRYFENHDELYWNVTGNEWEVPIENSSASIIFPEKISREDFQFDCFTGSLNSKEKSCQFEIRENGEIHFLSSRSFSAKEGLTIVLGWPKGVIQEPSTAKKIGWQIKNLWPILIPILTFIFLLKNWWQKGKDPVLKKTIIAQYEPPDNIRPAEMNFLINQRVQPIDISATLIDLAVRGYLKIAEIEEKGFFKKTDYKLIKLKDFSSQKENLSNYEREILEKIFSQEEEIKISELKNNFYKNFSGIKNKIDSDVLKYDYFVSDPQKASIPYLIFGIVLLPICFIFVFFNLIFFISILATGILFLIFSAIMPKRTEKGVQALWHARGFKEYIKTAEKYRVQFQEKENIFEKYLPYAIVLGLTEKWAKAFEDIYLNPPSWYQGSFGPNFTTHIFVNSLNNSLSSMNFALAGTSSSSGLGGGGFAGGGGGGGGGGSW